MIYITGDIHGNKDRFHSILDQIRLTEKDTLYILGDVVDRNPGGIELLEEIMQMNNAKLLLGNHEYMMLHAVVWEKGVSDNDYFADLNLWYRNGGNVTHDAFRKLKEEDQRRIIAFLRGLPLYFDLTANGKRYRLVHGTSVTRYPAFKRQFPNSNYYRDRVEFAVWERWEKTTYPQKNYTMIFGHTPTCHYQDDFPMRIFKYRKVIGIDCGAGYPAKYGGRLACLRLDDMTEFYSKEKADGQ